MINTKLNAALRHLTLRHLNSSEIYAFELTFATEHVNFEDEGLL
jgi:hypothetical protein